MWRSRSLLIGVDGAHPPVSLSLIYTLLIIPVRYLCYLYINICTGVCWLTEWSILVITIHSKNNEWHQSKHSSSNYKARPKWLCVIQNVNRCPGLIVAAGTTPGLVVVTWSRCFETHELPISKVWSWKRRTCSAESLPSPTHRSFMEQSPRAFTSAVLSGAFGGSWQMMWDLWSVSYI